MIAPSEDIDLFQVLKDNNKEVEFSEANQAWFFYDIEEDDDGKQILGDGQHYEESQDAAYAACCYYGYL